MLYKCRHCGETLKNKFLDFGNHPASNAYLTKKELSSEENFYPLEVYVCEKCWLVQIPEFAKPDELFTPNYPYFSSTSSSWVKHAKKFIDECLNKNILNKQSFVVEIASNDGYLLDYVLKMGINCLGIEPTLEAAKASKARGIKTIKEFFCTQLVDKLFKNHINQKPNLIIANNVVAHVPDLNDFMKGMEKLLHPNGFISIEFHHFLNLIKENQFDMIYHEHYSYLTLKSFIRIAKRAHLKVVNVENLKTHGGSIRVWIQKETCNSNIEEKNISRILQEEKEFELENIQTYNSFKQKVKTIKEITLKFLQNYQKQGKKVYGYGAAAKANTLINFLNVDKELIQAIADKSPTKQNKFLPGSHIPIISPEQLKSANPEVIIIFAWNLLDEIKKELKEKILTSYELYVLMPELKLIT